MDNVNSNVNSLFSNLIPNLILRDMEPHYLLRSNIINCINLLTDSQLSHNGASGLNFNPMLTRAEQRELTGWLKLLQDDYTHIPGAPNRISLEKDRPLVIMTQTLKNLPQQEQTIVFSVGVGFLPLGSIEVGSYMIIFQRKCTVHFKLLVFTCSLPCFSVLKYVS